jgi:hypothetical protein
MWGTPTMLDPVLASIQKNFTKSFFGNHKAENYYEIVSDLLTVYKAMGCIMSLKVHFLTLT